MSAKIPQDPWGDFWALNSRPGANANGDSGGCLPQRWAAIENGQRAAWLGFVDRVEDGGRVLDLATGDSRVLRWLQGKRPDLVLTGIDLSPQLPPPPPGIETRCGIAMESLPFEDASFDAVVSQFGFEYGDPIKVSAEIARVLSPSGNIGLLVHRGDGPILEHNRHRRNQLVWALKEKGAAKKTIAALNDGAIGIDKAAKIAGKIAEQGAKKFGEGAPAWELPEAIRRSCVMGRNHGTGSIIETIRMIEGHATNELGRIQSLARACKTADTRSVIVDNFAKHGFALKGTVPICEPSGREFADFITFG